MDEDRSVFEITPYIKRDELGVEAIFTFRLAISTPKQIAECDKFVWNICKKCWGQAPVCIDHDYDKHHYTYYGELPLFEKFGTYPIKEEKFREFQDEFEHFIVFVLEDDQIGRDKMDRTKIASDVKQCIVGQYLESEEWWNS